MAERVRVWKPNLAVRFSQSDSGQWVRFADYYAADQRLQSLETRLRSEVEGLRAIGYPPFEAVADRLLSLLDDGGEDGSE